MQYRKLGYATVELSVIGFGPWPNRCDNSTVIAWVNAQPGITSAIVGARRPAQIEETARAGDWTLSENDLAEIATVLTETG